MSTLVENMKGKDAVQVIFSDLLQEAEKLHAQTSWRDRRDWNKDFLSSDCVSNMRACSATDHQNGSDYDWKSNKTTGVFCKKVVFPTNVQHIFKRTVTDLNTQSATTQQRLTCALKNARFLPDGCCCLNYTDNKSLSRITWRCIDQGFHVAIHEGVLISP